MKYKDLIQFDPIDEIIKFSKLKNEDYRLKVVKDFICTDLYENYLVPQICGQLDLSSTKETKGIQIVGNYGTGKSHLMSLFSIIAEDGKYLQYLKSEKAKDYLKTIAGKYKVYRFELGNSGELWSIITYRIDLALAEWGVDYSIREDDSPASYSDKLEKMMAAFEEKYPDKGFMLMIDEMLSYLKGRSESAALSRDLAVLQALGQMSDRTHFRMVFGVQELIYRATEFQFAKDMLGKVNERFANLIIQKEDVQCIVQRRLLMKDEHQKVEIRKHLKKFADLFPDLKNNMDTFVDLYPVHPSYIDNFSFIRIGKSQREILKTLSNKFTDIMNDDVPENEPGLICYDSYWHDMLRSVDLKADPDVRRVSDITEQIDDKIENNFTGGRVSKKELAHRIVAASAIKILQDELSKEKGVNEKSIVNDLCPIIPLCEDFDLAVDIVKSVMDLIVSATMGQAYEKGENEYHIRIEGGVNYEQIVKDYASHMGDGHKDDAFFMFLTEALSIGFDTYRTNFKIWSHHILWNSHNCERAGYIFMGNPAERSTTQPEQHFYIYFMPIFNKSAQTHGNEEDSVYFLMDDLSEELKEKIILYGSAFSLEGTASSDQKPNFKLLRIKYYKEAVHMFNNEFLSHTSVEYLGERKTLNVMQGSQADSKIDAISNVSSYILEKEFNNQNSEYPSFDSLNLHFTYKNRENLINSARAKIINPTHLNRNGEAILMGLGLWEDGRLSTEHSQYARSLKQKLDDKNGMVLNRDEILTLFYAETNEYISSDFKIEADLEFLVMAVMATLGEIEIVLNGGSRINSGNISDIEKLNAKEYYSFSNICPPKEIQIPVIREIMLGLLGRDRTAELNNPNTSVFADLSSKAEQLGNRVVKLEHNLMNGCFIGGDIEVISRAECASINHRLDALKGISNELPRYNTMAKLRNINWTVDFVKKVMHETKSEMLKMETFIQEINYFNALVLYFRSALSHINNKELISRINYSIDKLRDLTHLEKEEQDRYKQELESLKNEYADYYMEEYVKAHIREIDFLQKQELEHSDKCNICKQVKDAVIVNPSQIENWIIKTESLKLANSSVTKQYLLNQPTAPDGFNPTLFHGPLPNISDLRNELEDIFNEYNNAFKDALKDALNSNNKDILTQQDKTLIEQFNNGIVKLDSAHAHVLMEVVRKLQQNFTRIEIQHSDVVKLFSRPMTKKQAIESITKYIEDKCSGHNPEDIRIIIK